MKRSPDGRKATFKVGGKKETKCPVCRRRNQRSHVAHDGPSMTKSVLPQHWNPDGEMVFGTWEVTNHFACSRGHRWIEFQQSNSLDPDLVAEEGVVWL